MRLTSEEEVSHIYQMGLDFCAKVSLRDTAELEKLAALFREEARYSGAGEDRMAVLALAQVCEAYNEGHHLSAKAKP